MMSGFRVASASISFEGSKAIIWPAMSILQVHGGSEAGGPLFERVREYMTIIAFRSDDWLSLEDMTTPLSPQDILSWLHSAWTRLSAESHMDVAQRKRALMAEVMGTDLDKDEQRVLVSALDYLARLASVQKASRVTAEDARTLEAPSVKSSSMSGFYRKMAALAATDLPIWISGERGTELDWVSRTIHGIRGLSLDHFLIYEPAKTVVSAEAFLKKVGSSQGAGVPEATVVFREMGQARYELQKELHDIIVRRLDITDTMRIIVTSGPIDMESGPPDDICPDLFAFLAPTSLEIPPLRDRREDIWSLMEFFAHPKRRQGVVDRLSAEAKNILYSYHWPRNTEELISVARYLSARRPTGRIEANHLPDTFHDLRWEERALKDILEQIQSDEGFRALRDEAGRKSLAQFLISLGEDETFTATDLQRVFSLGRETSRRLLGALESRGILEGIRGAKGERISRYRILKSTMGWE